MDDPVENNIVLIDGECVMCNGFAEFVMRRDQGEFLFGSQGSFEGEELLNKYNIEPDRSIVFLTEDEVYTESDAIIKILSTLPGLWSYIKYVGLVPEFIRDPSYRICSRYRYLVFGKKSECSIGFDQDRLID